MAAIDLYSGIGGWTLGFKLAGIPMIASFEWWKDANETHNKNFGSIHKEVNIRELKMKDLPNRGLVHYVVGSPPCTQFSFSNRGGKGNIADGLVDIYKFLEVVEYLEPKYWAMENVPRVSNILEKELNEGSLQRFRYLFQNIKVYNTSVYGVPQDRKRMVAGRFPFDLMESYAIGIPTQTLGDILVALNQNPILDPIYRIEIEKQLLTDHIPEPNLTWEEERINREAKSHHPVYNKMSFPDRIDRASRTITALCTRVSRESIIINDLNGNLRRLTLRERACLQSFPINYQFFGKSYASKIRMIGNAVPPLLTFYIAQAMLEIPVDQLMKPTELEDSLNLGVKLANSHFPDNEGANYPWNRSFWLAIKGLRFGSGVRFELRNYHDKNKNTIWRVNFFYGSSKNIRSKSLDLQLFIRAFKLVRGVNSEALVENLIEFKTFAKAINESDLQLNWTNKCRIRTGPITLIDQIAAIANRLRNIIDSTIELQIITDFIVTEFSNEIEILDNKKLLANSTEIFVGFLVGSLFNSILEKRKIKIEYRQKLMA
jgi:DNA (cytosine-5)-methyltransferase 1